MAAPVVSEHSLGAWLLKTRPDSAPLEEWLASDFAGVTERCVRPTYRAGLVRAGQPVLLWVSGSDPRHPAGIHAHGRATGPVRADPVSGLVLPVSLRRTEPPVARGDLRALPVLRDIEVLRMPAGSNPSYLDRGAYAALCDSFPQLRPSSRTTPRLDR